MQNLEKCYYCQNFKHYSYFTLRKTIKGKEFKCKVCNDCEPIINHNKPNWTEEAVEKGIIDGKFLSSSTSDYKFKKYGIDREEYNLMWDEQKGRCKICKTHQLELKRPLSVDHCHKTGKVRGLLCNNCNAGIGLLKDSPSILLEARSYILNSM